MRLRDLFFRDLAPSTRYWSEKCADHIFDAKEPLPPDADASAITRVRQALLAANVQKPVFGATIRGSLEGLAHSFLVILDGGTALAETERVHLTDSHGRSLGEGLHELFEVFRLGSQAK